MLGLSLPAVRGSSPQFPEMPSNGHDTVCAATLISDRSGPKDYVSAWRTPPPKFSQVLIGVLCQRGSGTRRRNVSADVQLRHPLGVNQQDGTDLYMPMIETGETVSRSPDNVRHDENAGDASFPYAVYPEDYLRITNLLYAAAKNDLGVFDGTFHRRQNEVAAKRRLDRDYKQQSHSHICDDTARRSACFR